jgi:amino acid transporter
MYFGKKNIGLRFRMSSILQVFPVTFGAGANTQDSERMRNLQERRRGLFFAAVAVVSVFVSVAVSIVVVVVAVVSVADLPL